MFFSRIVTEPVDNDEKLMKEILELESQIINKKKELRDLRKQAILKYCEELKDGDILYNLYNNTCYVYLGNNLLQTED